MLRPRSRQSPRGRCMPSVQPVWQPAVYTIQPVVKPVWQPVWKQVVSCKRGFRESLFPVTKLSDRCDCPVYVCQLLTWPSHSLERVQDVQEINAELWHMLPPYQFWYHRRGFNSALFLPDNMHLRGLDKTVTLWMFLLSDICCCLQMTMDSRQASAGGPVHVVLSGHPYIRRLWVYAHRSHRANLGLASMNINFIHQGGLMLRPRSRRSPRGRCMPSV